VNDVVCSLNVDAKTYGHGTGYVYSHDRPDHPQTFLPDELIGTTDFVINRKS
jgi:hypothetical protein